MNAKIRRQLQQRKRRIQRRLDKTNLDGCAQPMFTAANIKLELVLPPEEIWVDGDPTRLVQVVGNLLHNALKFTDAGGIVTVRLEHASRPRDIAATVAGVRQVKRRSSGICVRLPVSAMFGRSNGFRSGPHF